MSIFILLLVGVGIALYFIAKQIIKNNKIINTPPPDDKPKPPPDDKPKPPKSDDAKQMANRVLDSAVKTYKTMLTNIEANKNIKYVDGNTGFPAALDDGKIVMAKRDTWTNGFFPGVLWLLYKQDPTFEGPAIKYTETLMDQSNRNDTHDIGMTIYNSFGNALESTSTKIDKAKYKKILETAKNNYDTRFNANVGAYKSWDWGKWEFPVIIDSMMNIELPLQFDKVKPSNHVDTIIKNFYRSNDSSFHVVDFNKTNGSALKKFTWQGLGDTTSWSRGQAWGLYGLITIYSYTKNQKYLDQAKKVVEYLKPFITSLNIFPWDFNALDSNASTLATGNILKVKNSEFECGVIPYNGYKNPKCKVKETIIYDTSAMAVIMSALYKLAKYDSSFMGLGDILLKKLYDNISSNPNEFLLKNASGNVPRAEYINTGIIYGDYYFIEGCQRRIKL